MLHIKGTAAAGPALARLSAGRRVCRKYRKAYIRKLQQQEYDKLRSMVPSLAAGKERKKRISKIKVIEATIRYIDQLHHALAERLRGDGAVKIKDEQVAKAAKRMFVTEKSRTTTTTPPSGTPQRSVVCEKDRRVSSIMLQSTMMPRYAE